MANQQKGEEGREPAGFPVDDCFGAGIDRPLAELINDPAVNGTELITFEEFIRSSSKRRKEQQGKELDLRPIDEDDDGKADDGFFDIVLDGAKVPEDPISPKDNANSRASFKGRRSDLYAVQEDDEGVRQPSRRPLTTSSTISSTTTLRHSFCPTVGEGSGWLSGRTRRESQDSAAYGYEAPEEPSPSPKLVSVEWDPTNGRQIQAKMERQRGEGGSGGALMRSTSMGHQQRCATEQLAQQQGRQQMVHSNSLGSLVFAKFLCCFRALNPTQLARGRRCTGGEGKMEEEEGSEGKGQREKEAEQPPKNYSWDRRDQERPDPKDFCLSGLAGETRVKEPGQLNGQPFHIDNCADSLILLLDRSASVTVDDCRNCVILAGPCQGSIFLRDCVNVLVLAVCQQFRTRDCRPLVSHLFCTTAPTIEETDLTLSPLLLNYSGLQTQMHSAGLSPFVNRWSQVHNFTPDTGKCLLRHNPTPTPAAHNHDLVLRLNHFLSHSPIVQQWNLSLGLLRESRIFVDGLGPREEDVANENVLVLIRPAEGTSPGLRFYAESVEFMHELLDGDGIRLFSMHDIDLKDGEWEAIMGQKAPKHQKKATEIRHHKLITVEVGGRGAKQHVKEAMAKQKAKGKISAKLVEEEHREEYRKQLYRLSEIRQGI